MLPIVGFPQRWQSMLFPTAIDWLLPTAARVDPKPMMGEVAAAANVASVVNSRMPLLCGLSSRDYTMPLSGEARKITMPRTRLITMATIAASRPLRASR